MANGKYLDLPEKMSDAEATQKAKEEWANRFVNSDGTLKANRYAPIFARRGDERLVFLYSAEGLTLFKAVGKPLPIKTRVVVE